MKSRRGSDYWPGEMGKMIHVFKREDIVVSSTVSDGSGYFTGIVQDVNAKTNKVLVAWGGGSIKQHDPDEIMLHPTAGELIHKRLSDLKTASRRTKKAQDSSERVDIKEFVVRYIQTYNQFLLFHWQTTSYARHASFDSANYSLKELIDKFVEAYQGKYGIVLLGESKIPQALDLASGSEKEFCAEYRDFLVSVKVRLSGEDDLGAVIDEMIVEMNKLLYLLTLGG